MSARRYLLRNKPPRRPSDPRIIDKFMPPHIGKVLPTNTNKQIDVFKSFRPHTAECQDYNISQTELRLDAGDTKINVKDVQATYIPVHPDVLKKKKKIKPKPPPEKFITEIWMEEQNALQEKYKRELKMFIKKTRANYKAFQKMKHGSIVSTVGPEWYQELSPNQLQIVERLQCCILKDLKANTITNIQENLGQLGLLLRPNHRHIKKALTFCCKNPVEFLLILYQLMNPQRKEYSINDRLLLSAVVHLTMTATLRELHVRIPSPPVCKKVKTAKPKIKTKIKYPSPYLEPPNLLYRTGGNKLYENPRIQYPESPYFSYLEYFPNERIITEDILELDLTSFDPEEAEVLEDMKRAQLMYDEVRNGDRVNLIRPTILKRCEDANDYLHPARISAIKSLTLPPLSSLDDSDDEECFCKELNNDDATCCEHEIQICDCQEECDCKEKSKIYTKCRGCLARERKKHVQRIIKGLTLSPNNDMIPIIEATVLQKTCDCLQRYQDTIIAVKAKNNLKCQRALYVMGGVAMTPKGPVYILSTALKRPRRKHIVCETISINEEFKQTSVESEDNVEGSSSTQAEDKPKKSCHQSTVTEDVKQCCTCNQNIDETSDEEDSSATPCECDECKCKDKSRKYTSPRCNKCQERERQKYIERIITGMKETASHRVVPIIEGTRLIHSCDCLQKYAERILSMEAREYIQSQRASFLIGGVAHTNRGPVYLLSTALQKKDDCMSYCKKNKKKRPTKEKKPPSVELEEETDEEDLKYSGCKCKQELDVFLNHKCICEKCNVNRRQKEATYIMGGAVATEEDDTVNLVQGVHEQRCDCLERYKEKMDQLDDYRKRIEARYNLRSQSLKYSIGGVVNTPNGPVYVITGMRPPVDCPCAKALRQKEEEEIRLKEMAKMPPTGRIKYQISGVRRTPEGNVFIISQALAIDDCDCMKLYDSYVQAHSACLDAYENFLLQTEEELAEYMADCPSDVTEDAKSEDAISAEESYIWDNTHTKLIKDTNSNCSFSKYNLLYKGEVVRAIEKSCGGKKRNICSRGEDLDISPENSLLDECLCEISSSSSSGYLPCTQITLTSNKKYNTITNLTTPEPDMRKVDARKTVKSKRFLILDKMPTNPQKQLAVLKKVLATMAEDGFPLAKLPDCHTLPHFTLWMQMRCHMFWKQKDIVGKTGSSNKGWRHTNICGIEFNPIILGIPTEVACKMTWKHAFYIKRLIAEKTELFYRQIGTDSVHSAREFFPLSQSYQFPNKTFRDVYFAYMPGKIKDTNAFRIVQPHDTRIILKKYSCSI